MNPVHDTIAAVLPFENRVIRSRVWMILAMVDKIKSRSTLRWSADAGGTACDQKLTLNCV
jgi:hypothetical protein